MSSASLVNVSCPVDTSSLRRILTYNCSCDLTPDCALNYALCAATALVLLLTTPRLASAAFLVAFYTAFQLILCLFVASCWGVSVIWNALLGSVAVFALRTADSHDRAVHLELAAFVTALGLAVDVYYVVVGSPLTTIAHIAAIVLGVLTAQIVTSAYTSLVVDRVRHHGRKKIDDDR